MPPSFRIEVLTTAHDREDFACGVEPLDRYLARQAGQDMRRRVSNCFVAISDGGTAIAGYGHYRFVVGDHEMWCPANLADDLATTGRTPPK